ncbi:alpha/beta fold hydrolase [Ferdinandcohnia sp. Marseille-Q9671]
MGQYISIHNAKLWTEKRGNGVPVILLSGGPGTYNYLEPVAALIDDACEVIMFDPKGCGRSTSNGEGYELQSCLEDIERIRTHYDITKWIVIGHSWGADVGLAYSLLYSQSTLGYGSISGTGIQNDRDWKEAYKQKKLEIGEELPDFAFEVNKKVHRSLINSWRSFIKRPTLLKEISQLEIPSLFVYAANDIRPSWPIKQISNLIKNSTYIEIEDTEHYIWLCNKEKLREILREFIENL